MRRRLKNRFIRNPHFRKVCEEQTLHSVGSRVIKGFVEGDKLLHKHRTIKDHPVFEQYWFLEKVFAYLDFSDLLDCSLVNHNFLEVSRRFIKTYSLLDSESFFCLNRRVASAPSLSLRLGSAAADILAFRFMPPFQHLTSITFSAGDHCLGFQYSEKSELTELKHLQIWPVPTVSQQKLSEGLIGLTNLQSLCIRKPSTVNILDLSRLPNLTSLELSKEVRIDGSFTRMSVLKSLIHLTIPYPQRLLPAGVFHCLGQMTQLHTLRITDLSCSMKFLENVVANMPKLKTLYLRIDEFSDERISLGILSKLSKLQELEIRFHGRVGDMSCLAINTIPSLTHVKASVPSECHVAVLPYLIQLKSLTSLCIDTLVNNNEQRQFYQRLSENTSLTELTINRPFADMGSCIPGYRMRPCIARFPNLKRLNILDPQGFCFCEHISDSVAYNSLTCLKIDLANIGVSSLIQSVKFLYNLKEFHLRCLGTRPGKAYKTLAGLGDLKELTTFALTASVSEQPCLIFSSIINMTLLNWLTLNVHCTKESKGWKPYIYLSKLKKLRHLNISAFFLNNCQRDILFKSCSMLRKITII